MHEPLEEFLKPRHTEVRCPLPVARVRQAMVSSLDDMNLLVGPQMVEDLPRLINGNEFIRLPVDHETVRYSG